MTGSRVPAREWWESKRDARKATARRKSDARIRALEEEIKEELRDARSR